MSKRKQGDREYLFLDQFLNNDVEACIQEIEQKIPQVIAENPSITAFESFKRYTKRKIKSGVNPFIIKDYSKTIGNFLGGETFKIKPKSQTLVQLNIWANK